MKSRYEQIVHRLSSLDLNSLHVCPDHKSGCRGCKLITQEELGLFLSGKMQRMVEEEKQGKGRA